MQADNTMTDSNSAHQNGETGCPVGPAGPKGNMGDNDTTAIHDGNGSHTL